MMYLLSIFLTFFLFSAPATSEIYTLSLHDALPISRHLFRPPAPRRHGPSGPSPAAARAARSPFSSPRRRSEEHTSELQSRGHLVCRLLLEKKNGKVPLRFTPVCIRSRFFSRAPRIT